MKTRRLIMVDPSYFRIEYAINPLMRDDDGRLKVVDRSLARHQWTELKSLYEGLGIEVIVIAGEESLPDMVFAANQSFAFQHPKTKAPTVLMSRMRNVERQPEVLFFKALYKKLGYAIEELEGDFSFEGHGDAILDPDPSRLMIWAGVGSRTDIEAYEEIKSRFGLGFTPLKLKRPEFYHLDTCFAVLDSETVIVQPDAFTTSDMQLIEQRFKRVIPISFEQNLSTLACNCFCPNGRDVILQKGIEGLPYTLGQLGFVVHEVDTSEFLKAGGSVFCLKMALS